MPPGSWLGAWAAKARTRDTWTMPKGFTLVNLDEDPSFYFSPSPPPPDLCCDSKDWIGQTLGEKRKSGMARVSRVGSLRLGIELLQRSLRTALPQCPLGGVGQFPLMEAQ